MTSSDFLDPLKPGAEASPYADKDLKAVYKLFDLRINGSLGKKIELARDGEGAYDVMLRDASLADTLQKLSILNQAGAHPTEIVGLSESGTYLVVKQPLAPATGNYLADRETAISRIRGVVHPVTGLRRMVVVVWLNDRPWLVTDLHPGNIMRDHERSPTIIDALTGPVPLEAMRHLQWLREAVEDAQALREGRRPTVRKSFDDVDDDSL